MLSKGLKFIAPINVTSILSEAAFTQTVPTLEEEDFPRWPWITSLFASVWALLNFLLPPHWKTTYNRIFFQPIVSS
jgi:hypothetical protein